MMSTKGTGTPIPIPIPGEQRVAGGTGHVNIGGQVVQGTNLGYGKVQTPDGKIHG